MRLFTIALATCCLFVFLSAPSHLMGQETDSPPPVAATAVVDTVSPNYEHLEPLSWMIGEWVDEDETAIVRTKCKWAENRSFITRTFTVTIDGQLDSRGTQVIGWDPAKQLIRSWVFDTQSGFGEAEWRQRGDRWVIKVNATLPDGGKASEVRIVTPIDEDSFTWQAVSREIDGQLLPSIDPVTIVRAPQD